MTKQDNELHKAVNKMRRKLNKNYSIGSCNHDWVKITNIRKMKFWYCIFIYGNELDHNEKFVCLECGDVRE